MLELVVKGPMGMKKDKSMYCEETVKKTINMIGGKWKMLILWELLESEQRYNELHRQINGISQKVLSGVLKELVADGLVERTVYPEIPPKVSYKISEYGISLSSIFEVLDKWGKEHNK